MIYELRVYRARQLDRPGISSLLLRHHHHHHQQAAR